MNTILKTSIIVIIIAVITFTAYFTYNTVGGPKETIASSSHVIPKTEYAKSISLYIQNGHITQKAIGRFESKFGIKVNTHYFENEKELLSTVISGSGKVDACVISSAMVKELCKMKLLTKLNHKILEHYSNLDQKFTNPNYDPGNMHSIPYMWGTTGLVINKKYIETEIPDWNIIFDKKYARHIALISNPKECISIPLFVQGYDLNTFNQCELKEAAEILKGLKESNVNILGEIDIVKGVKNESIWAAATYSGLIIKHIENNPDIEYILPESGFNIWVENMCIPKSSKKIETAHLFINHILDPKISAEISSTLFVANANALAAKYTEPKILANKYLYPPVSVLEKGQSLDYKYISQETNKTLNNTWHYLLSE